MNKLENVMNLVIVRMKLNTRHALQVNFTLIFLHYQDFYIIIK